MFRAHTAWITLVASSMALVACSNNKPAQCVNNDGGLSAVGGAVMGPIDNHCYVNPDGGNSPGGAISPQFTAVEACYPDAGLFADGGPTLATINCGLFPDGGPGGCTPVCGATDADGGPAGCGPQYGPTHYNSAGNDDDCKYQTAWSSTPIMLNSNVTFTFTALRTVDGNPATGANVYLEMYLPSENYVSSNPLDGNPAVEETPAGSGVYTIGPVVFDRPGQWTIRFHLNENCVDLLPDSPHGHSAFFVNVP